MKMDFLPVTKKDLKERGWDGLDIVLITGDAYVDHPSYGAAVIGRVLEHAGYKVGIIAQPDWRGTEDFVRLGKPSLFFGITAGNLDSMVANYTSGKRQRKGDDYSPGGQAGLRPDRATIVYANRVREIFGDVPIVMGGIEASLRRFAHYDWWDNAVRRSILVDGRGDILVYGMGEKQVLEIAKRLKAGVDITGIRGTVVVRKEITFLKDYIEIPSYREVREDKEKFNDAFNGIYQNLNPFKSKTVVQKHDTRFVIQFPPQTPLPVHELDSIYELPYARTWHPAYDKKGGVPGFETVKFSIISHRGCCGECSFCSLSMHQGRIVQSRSEASILREARCVTEGKDFKGTITDVGGPTANLYQATCSLWNKEGFCQDKHCLIPKKCKNLQLGYKRSIGLYNTILRLPKIKHLFMESGFRYDLLTEDKSMAYLEQVCRYHVSGQMKVAPEHSVDKVLKIMNKPDFATYEAFVKKFREVNKKVRKEQYLVHYFISAHPGSTLEDTLELSLYLMRRKIHPEQIQDFMPLPLTLSGCIYYTEKHPLSGEKVYVPKTFRERKMHRALIQYRNPANRKFIHEALRILKNEHLLGLFMPKIKRG